MLSVQPTDEPSDPQSAGAPVPLPGPAALRARHPVPPDVAALVVRTRDAIRNVLRGHDPKRLVVLAGPCSIHDPSAAIEYARRLAKLADEHEDELVVVMRAYFEKPRSTVGWKGLLVDPLLDDSNDLARGIELAREVLVEIGRQGVGSGSEVLGPLSPAYLVDLMSWAAIGARTVESQPHREAASGLPLPVGVKNGMDGRTATALDALVAIRRPHTFLGLDDEGRAAALRTPGNPDAHVVLRGGGGCWNADPETVAHVVAKARAGGPARPVLVDCSHGNSDKDHRRQGAVCRNVIAQVERGQTGICGFALESYLRPGRQSPEPGRRPAPGVSITDACIGWNETEDLIGEAAAAMKRLG